MEILVYFSYNRLGIVHILSIMEEIILDDKYILVEGECGMCNGCILASTENCLEITQDKCMEYDNMIWKEI